MHHHHSWCTAGATRNGCSRTWQTFRRLSEKEYCYRIFVYPYCLERAVLTDQHSCLCVLLNVLQDLRLGRSLSAIKAGGYRVHDLRPRTSDQHFNVPGNEHNVIESKQFWFDHEDVAVLWANACFSSGTRWHSASLMPVWPSALKKQHLIVQYKWINNVHLVYKQQRDSKQDLNTQITRTRVNTFTPIS